MFTQLFDLPADAFGPPALDTLPDILDVDQVAQLLRVRKNAVYRMIEHKQIPCRRAGKSYRFFKATILAWLAGDQRNAA